jgi:hypothetical protein
VFESLEDKFKDNFRVFRACWKDIVKNNVYLTAEFKNKVKNVYHNKKTESISLFKQFIEIKIEKSEPVSLFNNIENLNLKFIQNL